MEEEIKKHVICGEDVQKAIGANCGLFYFVDDVPVLIDKVIQAERDRLVEFIEKQGWSTEELREGDYIIKSIISIIK